MSYLTSPYEIKAWEIISNNFEDDDVPLKVTLADDVAFRELASTWSNQEEWSRQV